MQKSTFPHMFTTLPSIIVITIVHNYSFASTCNEQPSQSHSKPRRWKSMPIHQGWFTALYTQHLLDSQVSSLKFAYYKHSICRLYVTPTYFSKRGYPVTLLPTPRRRAPSLSLGTTWVRQLRSGSCNYPTAATKCNEQPSQSHSIPRRWKSMLIHQGWFTALYTQHLLDSQSFEFEICILQALNMPLIRYTNVFFQGRLSRHILFYVD